jgi:integrase/recombinase XerD
MTSILLPLVTGEPSSSDPLQLALAAHLARYRGLSREHTASDLPVFLCWCAERSLDPLAAQRAQLELYVRWCQEVRRFKPSTVSRRTSVVCGFYRTCVIDGILEHSPAEWLRRPTVSPESPTLGLTHLQFEALLTTARESSDSFDFALVAMLGLLGLRILEACGANVEDLGEEHGHRVLPVVGKGTKVVLVFPPTGSRPRHRSGRGRPRVRTALAEPAGRADGPARRHPTPPTTRRHRWRAPAADAPAHAPAHLRHHHARRRRGPSRRTNRRPPRPDPRTTMRYDRARKHLDRHPNYILASYMAAGT